MARLRVCGAWNGADVQLVAMRGHRELGRWLIPVEVMSADVLAAIRRRFRLRVAPRPRPAAAGPGPMPAKRGRVRRA